MELIKLLHFSLSFCFLVEHDANQIKGPLHISRDPLCLVEISRKIFDPRLDLN